MENLIKETLESNSFNTKWFNLTESQVKEMGHHLKNYLLNGSPVEKLRSLEILRSVSEYNSSMLRYISRRIIKFIFDWALFKGTTDSPDRGRTLFDSSDPVQQTASAEFLMRFLDSIDFWGRISSPESNLRTAKEKLLDSKIVFFPQTVSKQTVSNKLSEVKTELEKICNSIEKQDKNSTLTVLSNLEFYLRSIYALCEQGEELGTYFNQEIQYYKELTKKIKEWLDFSNNQSTSNSFSAQQIPKAPPRPDSPVDFQMITFEEDPIFDIGEKEWKSIKEEFHRLKEVEQLNSHKIVHQQENIIKKAHQIAELTYELNEKSEELDSTRKKYQKLIDEFKKYKEKLENEIEEKDALIAVMTNNKNQMREVFLVKEKENEDLCRKIEELKEELEQYTSLDTTRFSIHDLRISRAGSMVENLDEPDNLKYFSSLLCCTQGILYKNRSIEVGFCVKVEEGLAIAWVYIGNCMQKNIDYLETIVYSPDISVDISDTVEKKNIPPLSQANRKLIIQFERFFQHAPKLIIRYNSSSKLLQLPITSALFLKPSPIIPSPPNPPSESPNSKHFSSQIPFPKLQKLFSFSPSFQSSLIEPDMLLYTSELTIKLSQNLNNTQIQITSENTELLEIISSLCKFQLDFNESTYL